MQATRTFGRTEVSKGVPALVVALVAAFLLGGAGGYLARAEMVGQGASHVSAAPAAVQSASGGETYPAVRGGLQTGDVPTGTNVQLSAADASGDGCVRVNRVKQC